MPRKRNKARDYQRAALGSYLSALRPDWRAHLGTVWHSIVRRAFIAGWRAAMAHCSMSHSQPLSVDERRIAETFKQHGLSPGSLHRIAAALPALEQRPDA